MGEDHYRDESDLKKYRTETPNMIYDIGLTPYEGWLYSHFKRVCGAKPDGKCWKSVKTLSRETKMSTGRVSEARTALRKRGLIRTIQPRGPGTSTIVTIVDVWPQNMARYMTPTDPSPDEGVEEKPSSPEDQPSKRGSPHEQKKQHGMNEHFKNSAESKNRAARTAERLKQMREYGMDA